MREDENQGKVFSALLNTENFQKAFMHGISENTMERSPKGTFISDYYSGVFSFFSKESPDLASISFRLSAALFPGL